MCEVKKCVKSFLRKVFCRKKREDGEQGITLVEIIVGLTVVASIAAVVLTQVGGLFDRTQENEARGEITDIVNGIVAYVSQGGDKTKLENMFNNGYTSVVKHTDPTALVTGSTIKVKGPPVADYSNAFNLTVKLDATTAVVYVTDFGATCERLELYFQDLVNSLTPISSIACGTVLNELVIRP